MKLTYLNVTTYKNLKSNIIIVNPVSILSLIGFVGVVENVMAVNTSDGPIASGAINTYIKKYSLVDSVIIYVELYGGYQIPLMHMPHYDGDAFDSLVDALVGDTSDHLRIAGVLHDRESIFKDIDLKLIGPIGQPVIFKPSDGTFFEAVAKRGSVMPNIAKSDVRIAIKTPIKPLVTLEDTWDIIEDDKLAYTSLRSPKEALIDLLLEAHGKKAILDVINFLNED